MHFKMSAICFNLDQFKFLSSGNGLIAFFKFSLHFASMGVLNLNSGLSIKSDKEKSSILLNSIPSHKILD